MKKGILLFCGLFLALFVNRANAQDFDLDFYQYFNANIGTFGGSDAKSEATKWRGSKTDGSIGPIVTMNNISARVVQNSRINSISVGEDNTATQNFIRFQLGHNDCQIVLESTVDIKTIALVYRSSSTTATGLKISYGASADDVELAPIVHTFPSYDNSMEAPGQTVFYDIPEDGIKYIVIARSTGTSPKLYRIAASSTTFTALPLELLSFTAKADAFGKSVNLNWRTTNEKNTKDFSIERRTDNTDFVSIGTRNSQNTEGVHNYAFTDNDPVSGNAYYRLKQIDNDGKFTYSDIVSVNVTGGTSVSVYPNPTTDALNVGHGEGSNGSLSIFDLQGKSMISQALVNGSTNTAVNVANLTPGTYVLSIQNAGQQSTVKFIKK